MSGRRRPARVDGRRPVVDLRLPGPAVAHHPRSNVSGPGDASEVDRPTRECVGWTFFRSGRLRWRRSSGDKRIFWTEDRPGIKRQVPECAAPDNAEHCYHDCSKRSPALASCCQRTNGMKAAISTRSEGQAPYSRAGSISPQTTNRSYVWRSGPRLSEFAKA